ncbi:hypothetical protein [Phytoactinopolyspora halophila]|uniref:hypothetical protein n=1 Tax=Phytoactinopolyspora halophila TaxID=1981511 RepID=UPI000F510AAA|nr:hypothetical protein [Phytoactinopolyspora halophila]
MRQRRVVAGRYGIPRQSRCMGRVRTEVDLSAAALLPVSVAYQRATRRHVGSADSLPDIPSVVRTVLPTLT